ncbi:hypothetical protein [Vibrio genomosp. F10]|nr:hypothetical protein [Vibrio genomosp. F10]
MLANLQDFIDYEVFKPSHSITNPVDTEFMAMAYPVLRVALTDHFYT